ncbi:GNAT family N-acetyltransferase [Streptomyces sp. NPDC048664]|uniref:GNAT family N-acetyltransferase n=1 Tax=Streptomyces sp. NPDC048664 TaxID=3154505 RepID=UPI0034391B1B
MHPTPADIDVHPITPTELREWTRALWTGFLRPGTPTDEDVARMAARITPPQALGAFDGPRCVGTFRSVPQELTAVGGKPVRANAVTNVTVTPTHRRRGLLNRMMAEGLAAAKERGDTVATLISAEYPIYGRYGFGPAAHTAEWTIDVPRTGLDRNRPAAPDDGSRVDLVDAADVREFGPALHDRLRHTQHGVVDRPDRWWRVNTGAERGIQAAPWKEPFFAVHRSPSGEIDGLATYSTGGEWGDDKRPGNSATVRDLIATDPAAERALWHHLCSLDWVITVKSGHRAPDDLLPHLLPDPRAARLTTHADWLWVRILDVVEALQARTYDNAGALVLDVVDEDGLAGGRYLLEAGPDGAHCAPTHRDPDLTLPVAELATLWLGDESAVRLAALGRLREQREGAARTADALLRTSRRPWCPDGF